MLSKLSVPGRLTNLDNSRVRAYCAVGAGGECFNFFFYLFSFLSPVVGDGPI